MNRLRNQSSDHVGASISGSEAYFLVCTGQPSARSCDCWRFINKWAWMHLINMLDLGSGNHYKQSCNNNYCKLWLLICVFFCLTGKLSSTSLKMRKKWTRLSTVSICRVSGYQALGIWAGHLRCYVMSLLHCYHLHCHILLYSSLSHCGLSNSVILFEAHNVTENPQWVIW